MDFKYKAIDKKGKKTRGTVTVDTRQEAMSQLKAGGLRILELKAKKESKVTTFFKNTSNKLSFLKPKFLGVKLKKKRIESFREELESMGYDRMDITSILRGVTPFNFDLYKVKKDFELTDIQFEKIKSGKINKEESLANSSDKKERFNFSFRVPTTDLVNFTEQLSILLDTNVRLDESLETIQKNMTNKKLRGVIDSIIYDTTKGKVVTDAMASHPDVFPPLYIAMVKVGEKTGSELPRALDDVANFLKMRQRIKREFLKAAIYPSFVVMALIGLLIVMNAFIIPRFREMFNNMEFELPWLTQMIFLLSENFGLIMFGSIAVIVLLVLFITKIEYNRQRVKTVIDYLSLKIPVIKGATLTSLMYQMTLTLSITLKNGIDIFESLDLINNIVGNKYLKKDINDIYYNLQKGKDISEAFGDKEHITNIVKMAVTAGDKSGKLDTTLSRVSKYYEEELETKLAMLIQTIIPVSIIFLAAIIGPFIIGLYLPMISLTQQMNQME